MVLNLGLCTDKADKVGNFVFATNAWVLGEESAEAFKVPWEMSTMKTGHP